MAGLAFFVSLMPAQAASRDCTAVSADLAAARAAGKVEQVGSLYREAEKLEPACSPKVLFCMGRGAALANLDAAYDALAANDLTRAGEILDAAHAFGEPWPLMIAIGDQTSARARTTHDAKTWSDASVAYQKAYSALGEPALCDGEPPPPSSEQMSEIVEKLSVATLLAKPLVFFHSKCAPCSLVFLTRSNVASKSPRVLPITFESASAIPTAEGQQTLAAFSDCVLAQRWSEIKLSAHTDERGSTATNLLLSKQRLDYVAKALAEKGYKGRFTGLPVGKAEPLPVKDRAQLVPEESRRLERRIELRDVTGEPQAACFGTDAPHP